ETRQSLQKAAWDPSEEPVSMQLAGCDPQIMADAAHAVLTASNAIPDSGSWSGNFYTDEQVLAAAGVTDFSPYSLGAPEDQLVPDIFL
ncbi:MAG: hypothetical protein NTU93_14075, partial [Arthrobacter sp.]|nr:hypothetical protein [Arthrobacter sp.]